MAAIYGYNTVTASQNFSCSGCVQNADKTYSCNTCSTTNNIFGINPGDGAVFATTVVNPVRIVMSRDNNGNPIDFFLLNPGDNVIVSGYVDNAPFNNNSIPIRWYYMQKTTGFNINNVDSNAWMVPNAIITNQYGNQTVFRSGTNNIAFKDSAEVKQRIGLEIRDWETMVGISSARTDPTIKTFSPVVPGPFIPIALWNTYLSSKQLAHYPNKTQKLNMSSELSQMSINGKPINR